MKCSTIRRITGFGRGVHLYKVHGVTYVVSAYFQSRSAKQPTLQAKVKRILTGAIALLTKEIRPITLTAESVCSAAGEED